MEQASPPRRRRNNGPSMTAGDTDELHARRAALRSRRAWRWLFSFLLLSLLLTHVPSPLPHRSEPRHWDKLVHFGLYATLAGLVSRALALRTRSSASCHRPTVETGYATSAAVHRNIAGRRGATVLRCFGVFFCLLVFGLLDETTQPLTGRDFDWLDWLADGAGILSGIFCYEVLLRRRDASRA